MNLSKLIVVIVSSFVFWGALATTYILDFKYPLSGELLLSPIIDWMLTTAVVVLSFYVLRKKIKYIDTYFSSYVRDCIERRVILLYFLSFIAFIYCISRVELILAGATRETFVFDEGTSRFIMFASPVFVFMSAVAIVYNFNTRVKITLILGLVFVSIYNLSRSEIANLIFAIITLIAFHGITMKRLVRFSLLFLVLCCFVSFVTIYQGRASSIHSGIDGVANAFFKYKAFSFYLSEYSINKISGNVEEILYPFFGFFIERLLSIIQPLSDPISVQNSSFISDFRSLGTSSSYNGNVLYAWWSWFYGVFGAIGIVIKAIYLFFIIFILGKTRLVFTFFYVIYVALFSGYFRHPVLNADSLYNILALLSVDIFIIFFWKRQCNRQ